MRTPRVAAALLAAACVLAAPARAGEPYDDGKPLKAAKQTALTFPDHKRIIVDVVDTFEDRERGLMFRKKLPKDYGMLFVFPNESRMTFWMKNTLASLDIVFMSADKRITASHERVKPSTLQTKDEDVARVGGLAQFVLELPAGAAARRHLKAGDALDFDAVIPPR